jgi:glutamine amidotransferase
MDVAIIDYGSGNLHSAAKAFERAAAESGSGHAIRVTSDPQVVRQAERVVLPGVGAFADCLGGLKRVDGLLEALHESVQTKGAPFLGICVGMQLLAERGFEHGVTPGLGWIRGDVKAIAPRDKSLKIPHMGWNTLTLRQSHPLVEDIPTGDDGWNAYFVHSFHIVAADPALVVAETEYGGAVTAIVARDNIVGTQFHPEKSQKLGLKLIANFLRWRP